MTETMITMDDGAQLRTWTTGTASAHQLPVMMLHGGPGVADYLSPVAAIIEDLCLVHRFDQRGTGGSAWEGEHTIARHVRDFALLLDAWGHDRVVLIGHSFGTDLATFFLLAHPERVAGVIYLAGPFLGDWREADRATQRARRTDQQQARLDALDASDSRTEEEEIEFLALSWFTDHADQTRAWGWAQESARQLLPINLVSNAQLNADKRVDPLESHLDTVRELLPPGAVIIGGAGDSRPAASLRWFGDQVCCEVIIIADAGHDPWLEAPDEFGAALRSAVRRQGSGTAARLE